MKQVSTIAIDILMAKVVLLLLLLLLSCKLVVAWKWRLLLGRDEGMRAMAAAANYCIKNNDGEEVEFRLSNNYTSRKLER